MPKKQNIYLSVFPTEANKIFFFFFLDKDTQTTLMKKHFWFKEVSSNMRWSYIDMILYDFIIALTII